MLKLRTLLPLCLPVPYGTNPNTLLIQLRLKSILALKKKLGVESRALKASHDKGFDLIDAKNLRVKNKRRQRY
jgi:hypothetical protein